MSEVPSSAREITREEVVSAYQRLVAKGVTNPDDLNPEKDPDVKEANELSDLWQQQQMARAGDDPELKRQANLSADMVAVDAGFTDPGYLEEVISEWLGHDAESAEKQEGNEGRIETRKQIAAAIKKVRGLSRNQN